MRQSLFFQTLGVFFLFALLFLAIQFQSPDSFVGIDPYYHIRYAQKLGEWGWQAKMPWATVGIWSHHFADKELLFHLYLYPFTFLEGWRAFGWTKPWSLIRCGKFAQVWLVAAIFALLYLWMRQHKVRHPLFWLFLLLGVSSVWTFRVILVRPHVMSILFFLLGIYAWERRYCPLLGIVSLLYPLAYHAAFILPGTLLFFELLRKLKRYPFALKPLLLSFGATLLGYFFHPHFPNNLYINYIQDVLVVLHSFSGKSEVYRYLGSELRPYPFLQYLAFNLVWIALWVGWLFASFRSLNSLPYSLQLIGLLSFLLFLLSFRMSRLVEYATPLSIFFIATSFQYLPLRPFPKVHKNWLWLIVALLGFGAYLFGLAGREATSSFLLFLFFFLCTLPLVYHFQKTPFTVPLGMMVWVVSAWCQPHFLRMAYYVKRSGEKNRIYETLQSALATIPSGRVVYHCCWDRFPYLVYFGPDKRYIFGLDPSFLYHDPRRYRQVEGKRVDLWKEYLQIAYGTSPSLSQAVLKIFGATYFYVEPRDHPSLMKRLEGNMHFRLLWETPKWRLYQVE